MKKIAPLLKRLLRTGKSGPESKEAQMSLKESENRFRIIFEASNSLICITTQEGEFLEVNLAVTDILGYQPQELIHKNWRYFTHPDDLERTDATVRLARQKTKGALNFENRYRCKDGSYKWLVWNAILIAEAGLAYAIAQDITERKSAEQELQAANERLKYLLASTSAAIYTSKTSGDYTATSITENVKQITGYEPREFVENSSFWLDHIHPGDRQRILDELPRIFEQGKYAYEYRFLHKNGMYLWIRDDMRLIKDQNGEPVEIVGYWIDITERKLTEDLIRLQRDLAQALSGMTKLEDGLKLCLDAAISSSKMDCGGIYILDKNSGGFNLAYYTGLSPDFVKVQSHFDAEHPTSKFIKSGKPSYATYEDLRVKVLDQPVTKEGLKALAVIPFFYEGGVIGCLNIASHDLNEVPVFTRNVLELFSTTIGGAITRLQIRAALEESAYQWQTTFDASNDTICLLDTDQRILRCNNTMSKMFGLAQEEIIGKYCWEIVHGTTEPVPNCPIVRMKKSLLREEMELHKADRWFNVTADPILDENGTIKGVVHIVRDITGRKQAEEELKRYREHLEKLVEERTKEITHINTFNESIISTIPSAIVVLNKNLEIVSVNDRFFNLFDILQKNIVGKNFFEVINAKQTSLALVFKQYYKSSQKSVSFEDELEFTDNKDRKILRFYLSRIEEEEEKIFLAIEDITAAKMLEVQLIQSERLAATGMLTASIAHEINNPLQGMITHLELIKDDFPEGSQKIKNYEYVKINLNKIGVIVSQLLDIYRPADKFKAVVDLREIIKQAVQLIENKLRIQGVSLRLDLPQELPRILASRQQIYQVVLNLLLNALESIEGKGNITVSAFLDDHTLKIQIKDDGKGINKDDLNHLFSPFFSTKSKTGLGLFICQGFVKNHNGEIIVESEEGKGSIFTVKLPVRVKQ